MSFFNSVVSAVVGAMATLGVVDVDEDGEFDIDDVEEFLEEKFKLLVGASVDGMKKFDSMAKGCLDGFQTVLDVAGLVPGFGEFADGANGVIYTLRGDTVNAGLSFAACIPLFGDVTTGAKLAKKGSKYVKEVPELIDKVDDISDITKGVSNPVESNYVLFNKTHKGSAPVPKGTGPNGGRLQSHHGLQQQWAKENLSKYGYDADLAPTVTIETGKGMPHTSLSNAQNARRNARVASGNGKWSSGLQDELGYMVDDFTNAGFSKDTINDVLEQQYKMLDKLKVPYERIDIK